ncbi:Rab3 GTPase-activating protein non-catalytic subunit [Seminavis robusta]|uniref:Rab3 GTPase-activating protein non-catalytic subunit n=1 Tax=Seminavis robusta TaxID=568900 RepID=A0A9N8HKU6_9STRA|nr:Rab3 GTPase-activating protein non-catalytic subunit [Seminavis robusta]|eukprot:Sro760_g198440.1 Rab3 GTPase-activating protein non-catalytic subunit (1601) ;mRNA; r:41901-46795
MPEPHLDCSALLDHVSREEEKLGRNPNDISMGHFGHPPAPRLSMFRFAASATTSTECEAEVLVVALTKRCISAQALTRQSTTAAPTTTPGSAMKTSLSSSSLNSVKSEGSSSSTSKQGPFLVAKLLPPTVVDEEDQAVEESITSMTMVALEDLSLITVAENHSSVVFDDDPKKKRVQFDEPTPVGGGDTTSSSNTEQATAKIKNLQLRGFIAEERVYLPRVAVIFGTNFNRVLSVEMRFHAEAKTIVLPLSDHVEPLPLDPQHLLKKILEGKDQVPFAPVGGVNQVETFVITPQRPIMESITANSKKLQPHRPMAYVWVSYGDGTILRIHHAAFFRSVVGDELQLLKTTTTSKPDSSITLSPTKPTLQERLSMQQIPLLLRCETKILNKDIASFAIVPFPKYHPSPLAPLTSFKPAMHQEKDDTAPNAGVLSDQEDKEEEEEHDDMPEVCEAVLYVKPTAATTETFPTLCFYTSEDQYLGRVAGHAGRDATTTSLSDTPILGAVVGGTKAMVGGLVGAIAWGFGAGSSTPAPAPEDDADMQGDEKKSVVPTGFFPSLRKSSLIVGLYAGYEFHDSPRQVESFVIDPEGNLGATTDSFGRVMLVELSTKQVVRMWKGFREASCCWLQVPRSTSADSSQPMRKSLFLVIHSRQRRVVEVYRVRHGPRVKSFQVGRDAQIVSCREWISEITGVGDYLLNCYIVHTNSPGANTPQIIEKIVVQENEGSVAREESSKSNQPNPSSATNPKEAALRLQRLQQLLANTNVPCQLADVHNALLQIKSLKDLATCLDRLSVATVLESKMGVTGSEFQKVALAYCRESLKEAVKNAQGDPASNPHVKLLATKIVYHTQVINAFDILRRFELGGSEEADQQVAPRSPWTEEAMGWVSTYDMVNGKREEPNDAMLITTKAEPLTFATFANACVPPKTPDSPQARDNRKIEVYLSDSSKTRRDVLVHIFKPLLGDIFAFSVVNSIFGALGIMDDGEYLLKVFGEWYMTLSTKEAAQKGFYALYSPMMRWLQEMVGNQLDRKDADPDEIALKSLYNFCTESADLVKAFMLGALCREAVSKAAIKMEEKTYGKIRCADKVKRWDELLRKLRVCLLVSLRLKGVRIGTFPITVQYVDKGDIFSVYEWLAHDELAMSHKHKEITTLEEACKVSGISFDPSTEQGDVTSRFEMLQNACLSAALSEEERTEYLVDFDDDDKLGALLLFLKSHNEPKLLVAHRALLLASIWSQNPHDLSVLQNALVALQSLSIRDDLQSLAAAIRLEVWQTRIRPIYRALLFGFHDVQEVSEHVVAPLFHQPGWVNDFGGLALEILTLLLQIPWSDSMNTFQPKLDTDKVEGTWPRVKPDFILERLVQRSRQIDRSALDAHRVVLCTLRVSDDIQAMIKCVPSFHDCFESVSLYQPVQNATVDVVESQRVFLDSAIISYAQKCSQPVLESVGLGEIETLGAIWKFDIKAIRTTFILAMYEFGKDRLIDEQLTKSASLVDVPRLVDEGLGIVCRRLNDLLHSKRRQTPALREVMSLLDPDVCSWVKDRAEESKSLVVFSNLQVPVGNTHLFALRLLSLSRGTDDVDKSIRVKIHSLIVLTGQLVKSLEGLP